MLVSSKVFEGVCVNKRAGILLTNHDHVLGSPATKQKEVVGITGNLKEKRKINTIAINTK